MLSEPGCLKQMVDAYAKVGGNIIAVEHTDTPELYGVVDPVGEAEAGDARLTKIKGMVEKPARAAAPSSLFIAGRYILQPEIFALLDRQQAGQGGEIQLTDAMAKLMASQAFHAFEYAGRVYDCGDKIGYLRAVLAFALNHRELGAEVAEAIRLESDRRR
jgi:UTP--glucose-1-phosphate uridylyltransferase